MRLERVLGDRAIGFLLAGIAGAAIAVGGCSGGGGGGGSGMAAGASTPGGGTTTPGGGGGTTPPPPAPPPPPARLAIGQFLIGGVGTNREAHYHAQDLAVLGITLDATGGDVDVVAVTVTASGAIDETTTIERISLFEDSDGDGLLDRAADRFLAEVGPQPVPFVADDGQVRIAAPGAVIGRVRAGLKARWIVAADLVGGARPAQTVALAVTGVDAASPNAPFSSVSVLGLPVASDSVALFENVHLLISELCTQPNEIEFIEIYNPTARVIFLETYYITDGTDRADDELYYNVVTGTKLGGGTNKSGDFHCHFPAGSSIQPGQLLCIAMKSGDFKDSYGRRADFEMNQDGLADMVPDMVPAAPGAIGSDPGLSSDREILVLYRWDGQSDLVTDVDYVLFGDAPTHFVDKSGVTIDGPDADGADSAYAADTNELFQKRAPGHFIGRSTTRIDFEEGNERRAGGNGVAGHDETSEDTALSFTDQRFPTPGAR